MEITTLIFIWIISFIFLYGRMVLIKTKDYYEGDYKKLLKDAWSEFNNTKASNIFVFISLPVWIIILFFTILLDMFFYNDFFFYSSNWRYGQTVDVNDKQIIKIGKNLYKCGCQMGSKEELYSYLISRFYSVRFQDVSQADIQKTNERLIRYAIALKKMP